MNPDAADQPQIGHVSRDERDEAFVLVCSRLAVEERREQVSALLASAADEDSARGLLGAYRQQRLVGAVFSQVQPGKDAVVWPPRVVSGEPAGTAGKLLDAASDWLGRQQVRVAQVMLQPDALSDEPVLRAGGFERLADLLYLVSQEEEFPKSPPPGTLHFEPYCVANHRRLARIVDATYEGTLDCPRLDGLREIEHVLAGYRATGVFGPERWLIVRHNDKDVGCLLLADHPAHGNWELVYMGVAVSCRGRGWGMDIARHAQWLTRRAGRPRLVLAVDAANDPAIKMYSAVGFQAWDRRRVYLKVL